MRKLGLAILLVALVAGCVGPAVSVAQAASLQSQPPRQANDPWEDLFQVFQAWSTGVIIAFRELIVTTIWWFEKLIALITISLTETNLWRTIMAFVMDALKPLAARQIRDMAFGVPGIVGLLYVAVMLAGLLMIVPTGTKLVKIDRVLLWAALISVLFFTAGQPGFDLMASFEELRLGMMKNMLGASGARGLYDLLAMPMLAPNTSLDLTPLMSDQFKASYFPPPQLEKKVIRLVLFKLPIVTGGEVEVGPSITVMTETKDNYTAREGRSILGLLLVLLCLIPTYVIAQFGLVFGCLAAGAIILMVFFVATIPLGFFEFGASILMGLVKQYVYLFALTILASTLVALMLGITAARFPAGIPDFTLPEFVSYLVLIVVIGIGMTFVSKMAWEAMTSSFDVVGKVTGEIGALAFVGGANPANEKQQDGGLLGKVGTAGITMGLAALTGGSSLAIAAAGAGTMLGRTKTGSALGRGLMLAGRDNDVARDYSAAAMGGGDLMSSAMGIVSANLMLDARRRRRVDANGERDDAQAAAEKEAAKLDAAKRKVASMTVDHQSAQMDPRWGAAMVDAGGFLTTNMQELDRGEELYFAHKDRAAARIHLERAYGSGQTADVVLDTYDQRGQRGAQQVRQATELAQATAIDMTRRGEQVFTEKGRASAPYVQRVLGGLDQIGALQSAEDAERFGQIAGATVRRPVSDVWADQNAKYKLASQVLNPETVETLSGDLSASLKLKEMTVKLQWDETQLAQLFDAVRAGQAVAVRSGRSVQQEVADIIGQSQTFGDLPPADREEAARLATLVARGAQIQQPVEIGSPTAPARSEPLPLGLVGELGIPTTPARSELLPLGSVDEIGTPRPEGALARTFSEPAMRRALLATDADKGKQELLRAVGTRRGAESVLQALDAPGHSRQDAEQLAHLLTQATSVMPASFDESGRPTAEYRDLIDAYVRGLPGVTPGAVDLFNQVADDVLWDADGLAKQPAEVTQRILSGQGATAAEDLRGMASYFSWEEAELAEVMAAALNGMSPKAAKQNLAALAQVPAGDVPLMLATARDAARETQESRVTAQVTQATAQVAPPSGSRVGTMGEAYSPTELDRLWVDQLARQGGTSAGVAPGAREADGAHPAATIGVANRVGSRVEPVAQADAARPDAADNSAIAGAMSAQSTLAPAASAGVAPGEREADGASHVEPVAQADAARPDAADNSAVAGAMSEMGVAPSRAREADGASRVEPVAQADAVRPDAADNSAVAGAMSEMGVAPSRAREADGASRVEPQLASNFQSTQPIAQAAESQSVNPTPDPHENAQPIAQADAARPDAADNSAVAGAMSEMGVAPSRAREADGASRVEPQPVSDSQERAQHIAQAESQSLNPTPDPHDAFGMTPEERAAARASEERNRQVPPSASVPDANMPIAVDETIAQIMDAPPVPRQASTDQPDPAPVAPPIPSPVADEADLPIIMPLDAASLMQPGAGRARKKRGARKGTSANDSIAGATAPGAATPPVARKSKSIKRNL
jgi:hypothetical protein